MVTATLTKATPNRLVYLVAGDAEGTALTIPSATLLADAVGGPLKGALSASYTNQAAMRAVFGGGNIPLKMNIRTRGDVFAADVDVDAITPARPEVNLVIPATNATAYLVVEHKHTRVR